MIGIIDYGAGNIHSVKMCLQRLNIPYVFSSDVMQLAECEALIFPGQGSAGPAMHRLRSIGLDAFIQNWRKPFLGICLGMQLLGTHSEEDNTPCLGIIPFQVKKFPNSVGNIPAMGWNTIQTHTNYPLVRGIASNFYTYCVHSFYAEVGPFTRGITEYGGIQYSNIVEHRNFTAMQSHPEKSGDAGSQFILNWYTEYVLQQSSAGNTFDYSIAQATDAFAKRIIPCLDVKNGRTVKGVNFIDLRDMGDPVELAKAYSQQGADELVFLDITATHENRDTQRAWVQAVAEHLHIPFTVGGGVKELDDAVQLFQCGADKVSVNSAAVKRPELIREISHSFGAQSLVLAVDYKRITENEWTVCIAGGRIDTGKSALDWIEEGVALGAGELLLTGMDFDGTRNGFDIPFMQEVQKRVNVPLIASGGAGNMQHFADLFQQTRVSGGLAASIFHENSVSIPQLKSYLKNQTICVR